MAGDRDGKTPYDSLSDPELLALSVLPNYCFPYNRRFGSRPSLLIYVAPPACQFVKRITAVARDGLPMGTCGTR